MNQVVNISCEPGGEQNLIKKVVSQGKKLMCDQKLRSLVENKSCDPKMWALVVKKSFL